MSPTEKLIVPKKKKSGSPLVWWVKPAHGLQLILTALFLILWKDKNRI